MKNKKSYLLIFLIVLILVLFAYRYHEINRPFPSHHVVQEKIIPTGKLVKNKWIDYRVLNSKVTASKDVVAIDIYIYVKLLAPYNYGFKDNSLFFNSNMYFGSSYEPPAVAGDIFKENGERISVKDYSLNKPLKLRIHFEENKQKYALNYQDMRFSFLFPETSRTFIKYSTFIGKEI